MFSKFLLSFLFVISLFSCATIEQPSSKTVLARPAFPSSLPGTTHTIQPGETLWHISKIYRTDLDDILKANRISDAGIIAAGQTIVIPQVTTNTPLETSFASHDPESDFIWPTKGEIISHFKEKRGGVFNKGIHIQTKPPEDVFASRSGRVTFVGMIIGYGPTLIIDHEDGLSTIYCGNASISVKAGDSVKQGMVVAKTDDFLKKDRGLIHFEVRKKHKPQNPMHYLVSAEKARQP